MLRWGAILLASLLFGQAHKGEIRIEIKDPSGTGMESSGRLVNVASGQDRSFRTDAQGKFTFTGVDFGRYRLEVTGAGFAPRTESIEVRSEAPVTRAVTMTLAATAFKVDVVAATPLPGGTLTAQEVPAPVQVANSRDINQSGALDLSDFLNRRLNGVHLNEVQDNPFQPDLNYRGYTASPLLGTPEGISVYMDGVRLNQPFGDVVSWDLIPRIAISEVALMPGSNPMFGLNALGGAISIGTKDGHSAPGLGIQLSGGSYGRRAVELENGGAKKAFDWYVGGNLFHGDGWRDDSPSDVRQVFSKFGSRNTKTALGLTFAYADNDLVGNGLQEQRLLASDYASVYTRPDITHNRSPFLNFSARHTPSASLTFSGNAYFRYIRTDSFNGDLNDDSLDQSVYQPSAADIRALTAAGYTGFPTSGAIAANTPFPFWRCIAQVLQRDEPGEKCNGLLNRTFTKQDNYGVSGQFTWLRSPRIGRNQFTAGAAFDRSSVGFQQSTQLGYLNPDRSVTGLNAFADGVTGGNVDGVPFDTRVDLHGTPQTWSLYATDTYSPGKSWNFTLSGRYNRTTIDNLDRIEPGGGPGSLNSHNVFGRLNPAAGVTYSPAPWLNAYFSYSESSRAPTSIELGCADPTQPCKLPNALAGDPPLRQVVTRTFEAGVRSGETSKINWNAGWFRGVNRDDLLFVASTQTGFGYFKNFGKTRRQGFESGLNGRIRRLSLGGGYTFLDATYQSPETVDGSSDSSSGAKGLDGTIQILPGDLIPLIPQHMVKAFADLQATKKIAVNLGFVALSSSLARGNEDNQHQADGVYYLGPGVSPGYALVNLGGHYQVHPRVQLFVEVDNLLDRHYYTGAQLGATGFTSPGAFIARPFPAVGGEFPIQHATFYAPGAPRTAWGGIRFTF
jgi:outer membrane receptor protein involved in Fe transport